MRACAERLLTQAVHERLDVVGRQTINDVLAACSLTEAELDEELGIKKPQKAGS